MIRIAIVDDCSTFTFIVEHQVKKYNESAIGHKIDLDIFNSPINFMNLMKTYDVCNYDIVLIDIHMPVINGFEVYNEIKSICRDVRCFLISGTIYKHGTFKDYQSIVQKNEFRIRDIMKDASTIDRMTNHLELDIYEDDTKTLHIKK